MQYCVVFGLVYMVCVCFVLFLKSAKLSFRDVIRLYYSLYSYVPLSFDSSH